jgi:coenzyme PQQ precursor peptide PqqA
MTWTTPKIVEIALGAEINCYACAELPADQPAATA